jgi:hypothetical protein
MKGYIIKYNVTDRYFKGNQTGTTEWLGKAGAYKTLKKAIKAIKRNCDARLNNSYTIYSISKKGYAKEYLNFNVNLKLEKMENPHEKNAHEVLEQLKQNHK